MSVTKNPRSSSLTIRASSDSPGFAAPSSVTSAGGIRMALTMTRVFHSNECLRTGMPYASYTRYSGSQRYGNGRGKFFA